MCRWLGVRFNDAKPKLCEVASAVFLRMFLFFAVGAAL
jgi:hypothetical protein